MILKKAIRFTAVDCYRHLLAILIPFFVASSFVCAQMGELVVTSGFRESETVIGRETTYFIMIKKADPSEAFILDNPTRPNMPKSSSLTFGRYQTTEQYQSSEGNDPVGVILEFEVVPNAEGRIIMPSFSMSYMNRTFVVPATSIRVRSPEFDIISDEIEWMALEFADNPKALKVGERLKTNLNLYVFKDLRNITFANPIPVGSDFSMDKIAPGPTERVVTRGLYRYKVYSWPLTYTAVRSGLISVSFKVGVNFRIPNNRLAFIRAARSNNAEGKIQIESLLQDSREESLTIFSDNFNVKVDPLELPESNSSFYGAMGLFDVSVLINEKELQVGQPSRLTIQIEGEGNFGAFRKPELQFDRYWRVFEPQEMFQDLDFLNYKARQSYEYVIIPLSSGIKEIPSVPYTFYDTQKGDYVTISSEPISLNLEGDSIVSIEEPDIVNEHIEEGNDAEQSLTSAIYWDYGRLAPLGKPFFKHVSFYVYQLVLIAVFLVFVFLRVQRIRLQNDQQYARKRQISQWIHKYLKLASIAAREEDSEQFYESAFLAFCAIVSAKNDHNVEAVTVEGVMSRVYCLDMNDNAKRVIRSYLDRYEHHRFSGTSQENPPLAHEYQRLKSILKKVESCLEVKGGKS